MSQKINKSLKGRRTTIVGRQQCVTDEKGNFGNYTISSNNKMYGTDYWGLDTV